MDRLLAVDLKDNIIGHEDKTKCHDEAILHRAFSVYIFNNDGELLIQRRSKYKPLWPLYWANSCCSHPRRGEDYEKAGERRLKEELGFSCSLKLFDKFHYKAKYKDIGYENELCGILVGYYDGKVKVNKKEAADYKWMRIDKLLKDFEDSPDKYTPWLKIGLKRYLKIKERNNKEISFFLKKISEQTEPIIKKLLEHHVDRKFHKLIDYQIFTGGKKIRPALVVACSNLLGGSKKILYPAAGIEILHNSTLIMDDIIDHSKLRRKNPTVWFKFGQSAAECMGVDYLAASFGGANRSRKPVEISEIFINASKTIIDGELFDILFEQGGRDQEPFIKKNRFNKIDKKDYYKMIGKKTAILTQSCCEVGAINADASPSQLRALKNYGFNLGLAFQVRDDVLDIFGERDKFGKKIGKDIEERKLGNIVILLALSKLEEKDKKKLLKIIKKRDIDSKDIKEAIKLIKKTNSKEEASNLANNFSKEAKKNLESLPQNKWNNLLTNLVDFVVQRDR